MVYTRQPRMNLELSIDEKIVFSFLIKKNIFQKHNFLMESIFKLRLFYYIKHARLNLTSALLILAYGLNSNISD
jgi:hypothetical protein